MTRPPSKGRGKTMQKRIENDKERAVTFSKRCGGLFKKASEISTLCGVQIAIIIFSLSGKPVSFGSPNVGSIVKKFLDSNGQADDGNDDVITRCVNSYSESKRHELNQRLNEVNERLVKEKKRGQILNEEIKEIYGGKTYEEYLKGLELDELVQLRDKLKDLNITMEGKLEDESSSSNDDEHEADLSKIGGPKDYLKL